jgi:hypothetical protein
MSRDSSVGLALGYGLDDWGSRVRFPAGAGNFSLNHRVQTGSGTHPASYLMGTGGVLYLGVKRPEREADHSPPSGAEVNNAWSYTSTPPMRLHGVVIKLRDNFTFNLVLESFYSLSWSINDPLFMVPESPSPCTRHMPLELILNQTNPAHVITSYCFKYILILSSDKRQ